MIVSIIQILLLVRCLSWGHIQQMSNRLRGPAIHASREAIWSICLNYLFTAQQSIWASVGARSPRPSPKIFGACLMLSINRRLFPSLHHHHLLLHHLLLFAKPERPPCPYSRDGWGRGVDLAPHLLFWGNSTTFGPTICCFSQLHFLLPRRPTCFIFVKLNIYKKDYNNLNSGK